MKSLFDAAVADEIGRRLGQLELQSERLWGTMSVAQMVAHCAVSLQWAVGEVVPDREALPARVIGRLIKPMVFRNEAPFRRNSPTSRSLVVSGERDLAIERDRLKGLVERFQLGGAAGCTRNPHSFFGRLTPEEWAALMYKHLDHHLRQFGV